MRGAGADREGTTNTEPHVFDPHCDEPAAINHLQAPPLDARNHVKEHTVEALRQIQVPVQESASAVSVTIWEHGGVDMPLMTLEEALTMSQMPPKHSDPMTC